MKTVEFEGPRDKCHCGAARDDEFAGIHYQLATLVVQPREKTAGEAVTGCLAGLLLPFGFFLSTAPTDKLLVSVRGWACDNCAGRILFIRHWARWRIPLVLALGLAITALYFAAHPFGRELWGRGDWLVIGIAAVLVVGLTSVVEYLLHYLVLWAASRPVRKWLKLEGACRWVTIIDHRAEAADED